MFRVLVLYTMSFKFPPYLIAGFALFAMLFGAGNTVFPIRLGMESYNTISSSIGFIIAGVLLPFIATFGLTLYKTNLRDYYSTIHPLIRHFLLTIIILLIGVLAGIPRCILVSYGAIKNFNVEISLIYFSFIYCVITLIIIQYTKSVVQVIGKFLTPALILSVFVLISASILSPAPLSTPVLDAVDNIHNESVFISFIKGLTTGYQTMDLLAVIFFATPIFSYIQTHHQDTICKSAVVKSVISAASLHTFVYLGLIYTGNKFKYAIMNVDPEQSLAALGGHILSQELFLPLMSTLIILACITTSTALVVTFNDFFKTTFEKCKLPNPTIQCVITLTISFMVSLTGFPELTAIIGKILVIFYPAIMMFSLTRIYDHYYHKKVISGYAFYITSSISIIYAIYNYIFVL